MMTGGGGGELNGDVIDQNEQGWRDGEWWAGERRDWGVRGMGTSLPSIVGFGAFCFQQWGRRQQVLGGTM